MYLLIFSSVFRSHYLKSSACCSCHERLTGLMLHLFYNLRLIINTNHLMHLLVQNSLFFATINSRCDRGARHFCNLYLFLTFICLRILNQKHHKVLFLISLANFVGPSLYDKCHLAEEAPSIFSQLYFFSSSFIHNE